MNRQELSIGVCVYALIITVGYSGPLLAKFHWAKWGEPTLQSFWLWFHPEATRSVFESKSNVKAVARHKPKLARAPVLDPDRFARQENWKKMAAHPAVEGTGQDSPGLLGKSSLLKEGPPVLPKKTVTPPEPSKG
jgi:hypothetical protein